MKSLNENNKLWMEIDVEDMEEREELGCLFDWNCFWNCLCFNCLCFG